MAQTKENISTILLLEDASELDGSEVIYLLQGTGSDRDRKITLANLLKSGIVKFGKVYAGTTDEQDGVQGPLTLVEQFNRTQDITHRFGDVFATETLTQSGYKVKLEIINGAVTTDKIADKAVDGSKLAAGAIDSENLIAENVINGDHIQGLVIGAEHLKPGAVTSDKIANDAVTKDKLADGAVTSDKLATDSVGTDKIKKTSITSEKLGFNVITATGETDLFSVLEGSNVVATGGVVYVYNNSAVAIKVILEHYPYEDTRHYCNINAGCVGAFICIRYSVGQQGTECEFRPCFNTNIFNEE